MNKLILGACALLAVGAASCGKDAADKNAYEVSSQLSDSVSTYYGRTIGGYILTDFQRFGQEHQTEQNKQDIVKGMQLVFNAAKSDGNILGLQIGIQMLQELRRYEAQGVDIDYGTIARNFKEVFMADTLDTDAMRANSETFQNLISQVQELGTRRMEAEAAAAAAENAATVSEDDFVASQKAADPDIKTTASGLSYKIIEKGDNTPINDDSMVAVNYTGKLTDGTVFDSSNGNPATFSPSGLIPGFTEGLKMLGKGGKAVLYIPGNLAYGEKGVPQAGIGPNATLVFEIEVVDVE